MRLIGVAGSIIKTLRIEPLPPNYAITYPAWGYALSIVPGFETRLDAANDNAPDDVEAPGMRHCVHCGNLIPVFQSKCRHCGKDNSVTIFENDDWNADRTKAEQTIVAAALDLFAHTGAEAFYLPIKGTSPPLFIAAGTTQAIASLSTSQLLKDQSDGHQ